SVPRDVAVAQQRRQVIRDRTEQGPLKVDDPRTQESGSDAPRTVPFDDQQIAAVEIAMHETAWLLQCAGQQEGEGGLQHIPVLALGRAAEMSGEEPLG